MANSYFQFKQFIVNQEKSAMKVCTDACVFGAYISSKEKVTTGDNTNILDIGTGTGLLSLMIAQKVKGNIDAVEIDEKAYEQAQENFKKTAWATRLSASHADVTEFRFKKKYDIIISNPPFFTNSLKSSNNQKNLAKHTTSLPFTELLSLVAVNLNNNGKFYVLLPFLAFNTFEMIATINGLSLIDKINIRHIKTLNYYRSIGVFTTTKVEKANIETLDIKDDKEHYSQSFIHLLQDYYLYL